MLAIYLLGTNYQNNLVLLVAYGLGSLFMVAMWLTHRNLLGLSLLGGPAVLGEAGSPLPMLITGDSGWRRWMRCRTPLLLPVLGPRRGRLPLERLRVESRYPLGLFRCWTLLDLQLEGWLAPAPEYGPLRGEAATDAAGNRGQPTPASMGDFDMLRAHQSGEPLSRVAWKQLAQGRGLLVKQFCEPGQDDTHLSLQRVGGRDLELRLAVLAWWCDDYAKRGIPFSLTAGGPDARAGQRRRLFAALPAGAGPRRCRGLQLWVVAVSLLTLGVRAMMLWRGWRPPHDAAALALLAMLGVALLGWQWRQLGTLTALINLLWLGYGLKLIEVRRERDVEQVLLLAFFLVALALVQRQSMGWALAMTGALWLAVTTLLAAVQPLGQRLCRAAADDAARRLNLQLPAGGNPKARAYALALKARHPAPAALAAALLGEFRQGDFYYTLQPPRLGQDGVDDFLFESRRGFCGHYATATAFVLRAAGVPARLVTATSAASGIRGATTLSASRGACRRPLGGEFAAADPLSLQRYRNWALLNQLRWWGANLDYQWTRWVLNYDAASLWQQLGQRWPVLAGHAHWLILTALLGVASLVGGLLIWRGPAPLPLRLWQPLRRRAARHGWQPLAGESWPAGASASPTSDPLSRGHCNRGPGSTGAGVMPPLSATQRHRTFRQLRRRLRQICRRWDAHS
ncbi:UNVERIFIED_CONTAM: hypothetical protein K2H54_000255 [Gekko kuhli]